MADEKDKTPKDGVEDGPSAQRSTAAKAGAATAPSNGARSGSERSDRGPTGPVPAQVAARQRRYLMAPRRLPGQIQPMSLDLLNSTIEAIPDVRIVKRLKPRGLSTLSVGPFGGGGGTEILVAETTIDRGELLRRTAGPHVIVEHDAMLRHHGQVDLLQLLRTNVEATVLPTSNAGITSVGLKIRVVGEGGQPLPRATVIAYGQAFPAQGTTDDRGEVELELFGGPIDSVQALYVRPESNHWERFTARPDLGDGTNVVALDPLSKTFAGFPNQPMVGWGAAAMGIDRLGAALTGRGIKVGIIDSGCDTTHPQLGRVVGVDCTGDDRRSDAWRDDIVHHGTHCAGVIGAATDGQGIRGMAPEAELHALKVFPGGRFSDLIEALDLCIEQEIDVVNLSLGSPETSELVAQKMADVTAQGIACIVAAGNAASEIQFPANLPHVLSVGAIGRWGSFPEDSYHAQTVLDGVAGADSIFAAKFSCFGPQLGVCAPGVAIVSTVPGGYAAWDGTSMAAPHVTGLAALILAHHPAFQGRRERSAQRIAQLFAVLRSSAVPVIADPLRGGAGLPDAVRALSYVAGLAAQPAARAPTQPSATLAAIGGRMPQMPGSMFAPGIGQPSAGAALGGAASAMFGNGGVSPPLAYPPGLAEQALLAQLYNLRMSGAL